MEDYELHQVEDLVIAVPAEYNTMPNTFIVDYIIAEPQSYYTVKKTVTQE